jgi:hypothetical protein
LAVVLLSELFKAAAQIGAGWQVNRLGVHQPSDRQQGIGTHLCQALLLAHQLVTVEIAGVMFVALTQVGKLLAHGLEHGVVVVQRQPCTIRIEIKS